jgi:hypothetical protein
MDNQAVQTSGNNGTEKASSLASDLLAVIGRWLYLAGSIMGKEVTPAEVSFWKETLEKYPVEKVDWAFRAYLERESFFPKPGQILTLIEEKIKSERHIPTVAEIYRANLAADNARAKAREEAEAKKG